MDLLSDILIGVIAAATPLVFAAIGELVVEKAGVLNLGVEGMMIMGAVAGFAASVATGSATLGVVSAMIAGAAMAALFGMLTLTLMSNQVATGLALTMFGLGLSALIGQAYSGMSVPSFPRLNVPALSSLPVIGRPLFNRDALFYLSIALVAGTAYMLTFTRIGLVLRAIGENHDAAHAIGYPVVGYRFLALMFGGACAGLGGAYLSLVQTPIWVEKMTAGRGWIALALVVFAAWRPGRVLAGAYLFGGISVLQLHAQGFGLVIDPQILAMFPYLATIVVLVIISADKMRLKLNAPASLGKPFFAPA
jgi:general nucleoside transport system permease protein